MTVTANAGEDVDEGEQWGCTPAAVGTSMEASQKPSTISHVSRCTTPGYSPAQLHPCQHTTETLEHLSSGASVHYSDMWKQPRCPTTQGWIRKTCFKIQWDFSSYVVCRKMDTAGENELSQSQKDNVLYFLYLVVPISHIETCSHVCTDDMKV